MCYKSVATPAFNIKGFITVVCFYFTSRARQDTSKAGVGAADSRRDLFLSKEKRNTFKKTRKYQRKFWIFTGSGKVRRNRLRRKKKTEKSIDTYFDGMNYGMPQRPWLSFEFTVATVHVYLEFGFTPKPICESPG